MQLTGEYIFDADVATIWDLLMDPKVIANLFLVSESLATIPGRPLAWQAELKLNVATVNGVFSGTVQLSDVERHHHYRLTANGEGQQSVIRGSGVVSLIPQGSGSQTQILWDADYTASGKLASVGPRLLQSTSHR